MSDKVDKPRLYKYDTTLRFFPCSVGKLPLLHWYVGETFFYLGRGSHGWYIDDR